MVSDTKEQAKALDEREEEHRTEFVEFLESCEHIENISGLDRNIDFLIGEKEVWPNHLRENDQIRTITRSSIALWQSGVKALHEARFVTDVKLHLPPAPESLRDEIDAAFDLPEGFYVHHGSTALGGLPAPEGYVTPHVLVEGDHTFLATEIAVRQAVDVYVDVYDGGEKAIKYARSDNNAE